MEKKPRVKASWLNFVKSEKAKAKIKSYLGIKTVKKTKKNSQTFSETFMKKIKMADCCHPLPGEDVIGYKTTKRKIIIHKKDCENLKNLDKRRLIEIEFERDRGKTELRVTGLDRLGLLSELLNEVRKSGTTIISTNFKIKNSGYVEAIFGVEIKNIKKLETLMENMARVPSIYSVERI
jgi:GTP pyrophosphokinase